MLIKRYKYIIYLSYFNNCFLGSANINHNTISGLLYRLLSLYFSDIVNLTVISRTDKRVMAAQQIICFYSIVNITNTIQLAKAINKFSNRYNVYIKSISEYINIKNSIKIKEYRYFIYLNRLNLYTVDRQQFDLYKFVYLCFKHKYDFFMLDNLIDFKIYLSSSFIVVIFIGTRFFYHQIRKFIGTIIFYSKLKNRHINIKPGFYINSVRPEFLILHKIKS